MREPHVKGFAVVSERLGKGFRRYRKIGNRTEIVLADPGEAMRFDRHRDAIVVSDECNRAMPGMRFAIYPVMR